ncbi:Uncharacterized protein APZ42_012531 [Daphnia magna]|uniref:Uncharacterized protein n=1 Tax=Daphnia magna TaxID=35525 RepID=A0A162RQG0_9CRUS|nr:Uncharacterized protein APZ42_012531 [Daphnia magna]
MDLGILNNLRMDNISYWYYYYIYSIIPHSQTKDLLQLTSFMPLVLYQNS